jgi:ABC-2 type transport system ATP-binding protein
MKDIAIQLNNISKEYIIHHEKPTLVEKFVKTAKFQKDERFISLNKLNLIIQKGDRVGISGPNGSGKTTLLKIITGITTPTSGTVITKGRVVSLIDLEAGFHPDLSGFQNIYLNGMLLGMTKKEVNNKLDDIIDFADIKQFIDTPLYTYSQGMKLRLGFAIAIHSNPQIMILDEGFLAGDEQFRDKASKYIKKYLKNDKTILMVSHWREFLEKNCNRIIFFDKGQITGNIKLHTKS